jgi:Mg-chelatase subunit ChlD
VPSLSDGEGLLDFSSFNSWDIATRYHEFKAKNKGSVHAKKLRELSAQAVLEKAKAILGSLVHPIEQKICPLNELPGDALHPDLELEETLENSEIWMSYQVHRKQSLVLSVDTSLSMTGEKLALTAVALAVVLLQFPEDPIGIVAFENEAKILKRIDEKISIQQLVERFLDVPAQGYTHLEEGLRSALKLVHPSIKQDHRTSTVLLTDGKYTAGRDPAYLGSRFSHLVVLKMGKEKASLPLCRELASRGKGCLREVIHLETLPLVMYNVVKDLLRGHSVG